MENGLRTKTLTINNPKSRDHGKSYLITEMNVLDIDEWSIRVLTNMARGGLNVRDLDLSQVLNIDTLGGILQLAQLAIQGFGNIVPHITHELLTELVDRTVQRIPEGGEPRKLDIKYAQDVVDGNTLWKIRQEAFNLHVDSFTLGGS